MQGAILFTSKIATFTNWVAMFHLRVAATILLLSNGVYAQDFSIASPKGDLKARLSLNGAPSYEVYHGEDQVRPGDEQHERECVFVVV